MMIGLDIPEWVDDALCSQVDPELFFPEQGESSAMAKRICGMCDVREQCLKYAVETCQMDGIWSGVGPKTRERIRSGRIAMP